MAVDQLSEVVVTHDIRYNPEHSELRFYDGGKLCCSINLATGKGEFHGLYKPDAISKIFWQCIAAAAPQAVAAGALAPLDVERIKRTLNEFDTLEHLSGYHDCYVADEDHGGFADEDVTEETIRECRDLEYVMNWLHPNYIAPAFPERAQFPPRDPDEPEDHA